MGGEHLIREHKMTYAIEPLGCDPGRLNGLSEKLIVSHYKNNFNLAAASVRLVQATGA
jgi:Fe-Mn family superoxide dismutase